MNETIRTTAQILAKHISSPAITPAGIEHTLHQLIDPITRERDELRAQFKTSSGKWENWRKEYNAAMARGILNTAACAHCETLLYTFQGPPPWPREQTEACNKAVIEHDTTCQKHPLRIECDQLKAKLTEATEYAKRLATSCAQKHWSAESPGFKPLEDLNGLLSQMDNMMSGMVNAKKLKASEKAAAAMRDALEKRVADCCEPDGAPDSKFQLCEKCKSDLIAMQSNAGHDYVHKSEVQPTNNPDLIRMEPDPLELTIAAFKTDILKPCPLCGGHALLHTSRNQRTHNFVSHVICSHCHSIEVFHCHKDHASAIQGAIAQWNKRHGQLANQSEIEAKLSERKTVHEWLNTLNIPSKEQTGRPMCLLRRLAVALKIQPHQPPNPTEENQ